MMQDFIGNDLNVGDYVAAGGSGNTSAEYGMILYQVLVTSPKLKLVRLSVSYDDPKAGGLVNVTSRKITATNPNKYVLVRPSSGIVDLFDRGVSGALSVSESELVGRWIHGADHQLGLFSK